MERPHYDKTLSPFFNHLHDRRYAIVLETTAKIFYLIVKIVKAAIAPAAA